MTQVNSPVAVGVLLGCTWVLLWAAATLVLHVLLKRDLLAFKLIVLPKAMKCSTSVPMVNGCRCDDSDIDGWSLVHVLIYITIGMVLPGYLGVVLVVSLLCEAFEFAVGLRARWWQDPLANCLGYAIGSALASTSAATWLTAPLVRASTHPATFDAVVSATVLAMLFVIPMGSTRRVSTSFAWPLVSAS